MFLLGRCNQKDSYNIFGSVYNRKHASDIRLQNIMLEKQWKINSNEEELLKKLKANIKNCKRSDFETEQEFILELKRRIFMYSSTKEIVNEKKRHMHTNTLA